MTKNLSILGATGSIGRQTLDVAKAEGISVVAMSAHQNVELFEAQIRAHRPQLVCMTHEAAAQQLRSRIADLGIPVLSGEAALTDIAVYDAADTVLTAVVGMVGLRPTLAAAKRGMRIALANKETLVCAGELVKQAVAEGGAELLPVDSEHSAIFQCLQGNDKRQLKKILLTASGGPFLDKSAEELQHVTLADALKHPNWSMGRKITVDSASLMNKGLEFIEAMHLFDVAPEQIEVLVHRESVIHSMVEYCDNSVIAQLGAPDMRLPIQYALCYPRRGSAVAHALDFKQLTALHFEQPDMQRFPSLALAMQAAQLGGILPTALNAANEVAVEAFLEGAIRFTEIYAVVLQAMERAQQITKPSLEDILQADQSAREHAIQAVSKLL